MLAWLAGLDVELIAGGVVGLSMVGVIARNAILGWAEAKNKIRDQERSIAPLTAALAVTWDRDQIERLLRHVESIGENMEIIAKSQSILSDQFQQSTQSKLNDLLEKLDDVQLTRRR